MDKDAIAHRSQTTIITITDNHFAKGSATRKGTIAYLLHGIGDSDLTQQWQLAESMRANIGNAFGEYHLRDTIPKQQPRRGIGTICLIVIHITCSCNAQRIICITPIEVVTALA